MKNLLETDRRISPVHPQRRPRLSRPARWVSALILGALFAAALGYLVTDQVRANDQFQHASAALGVTEYQTNTVSAQLAELQSDLAVLSTQVGNDSTALNQDASEVTGAESALAAAQAHVSQQATLIGTLQSCLGGVERALNALSVGKQSRAIAAVEAVSKSCATASSSSG
jgi:hypothetical protein